MEFHGPPSEITSVATPICTHEAAEVTVGHCTAIIFYEVLPRDVTYAGYVGSVRMVADTMCGSPDELDQQCRPARITTSGGQITSHFLGSRYGAARYYDSDRPSSTMAE